MNDLVTYLFNTNSVKVCPDNKPFWYTSGKIGPYFINTHFLYGSEKEASELLAFIDEERHNHIEMPKKVFDKVLQQYKNNTIYSTVINELKNLIETNINIAEIDYISGGERRDWYFSNIIAYLLKKPHLTIYKDLDVVVSDYDFSTTNKIENLNNKKILHVADLITEASSYLRAWIPAITNLGGQIAWSAVVVDRMQGGKEKLENVGINSLSLLQIDSKLFESALNLGIINKEQLDLINKFLKEPDKTMREFLINHPEFLENSLASDEKTSQRAKLCVDSNLYNL